MASQDHASSATAATASPLPATPALTCDLCQWPMPVPNHCVEQGAILGLLVCSQCVEDQLQSEIHQ